MCGEPAAPAVDKDAITNPTWLVDVTSASTEDYDRGNKLSHYMQLPSLAAVLFVSHKRRSVTVVRRTATGWEERDFHAGESVSLDVAGATWSIDAIYEGIALEV